MEVKLTGRRRDGNTTRQVDAAVQTLFNEGRVTWTDHAADHGNFANKHGFVILLRRLEMEHGISTSNGNLVIDKKRWFIALD